MKYLGAPQSGSQANTTASRNRFGQYYRNRAMPTQPRTVAQTNIRSILAGCSTGWATLDAAEQLAWQAWAELHPRTDSLGSVVVMSGAQAFNSVNCALVQAGGTAVVAPPADPLPDPPTLGLVEIAAPDEFSISFTPTPVPASTKLLIFASPPRSLGTTFNNDWRYMGFKAAASASPDETVTGPAWVAKFGNAVEGQRIFFRAAFLRTDGGRSAWSGIAFADPG